MAVSPLDPNEWDKCLGQMCRYHQNISDEIRDIITTIRKVMNKDLLPVAEEKATYGKVVKKHIRSMWSLEYEIEDLQDAFNKQLGAIDINNLTDDFVEEALLQSKPLQKVLLNIRDRQKTKMDEMIALYGEKITTLLPLAVKRPPKPEPKPAEPAPPVAETPAEKTAAPPAEEKPSEEAAAQKPPTINEPEPAMEAVPQVQVEASA